MTPLFTKALHTLLQSDVDELLRDEIPEGQHVEYKVQLPTKDGSPDPWIRGDGKIGDRARNEILEEVVAFANAEGGNLVLGIRETSERPARPDRIDPLPKCHGLAERIRHVARDCIEPQIPYLEVGGVPCDTGGAGIVLIRVPPSRMAPHRVAPTGRCTMRHADRTETMTMREIQDLTIDLARGDERLREKLEARRENYFKNVFKHASQSPVIGARATLIPVRTVVQIDRPYDQSELAFLWEPELTGTIDGKQVQLIQPGRQGGANPL